MSDPRPDSPVPDAPDPGMAELRARAIEMTHRSYSPYSDVRVGAAGRTGDGSIVVGCNVENASYGLGLCAECSMVSDFVGGGHTELVAVAVVAGDGRPLSPCGRCRQVLFEFGGAGLLVDGPDGVVTLGELLPWAFGPGDVAARAGDGSA